jgi:hypothetical protein
MVGALVRAGLAFLAVAGFQHQTWIQFTSSILPYSVSQPSSFRHVILQTDHKSDYFFPNLGSFTTNVNVYADPPPARSDDISYLRDFGGQHVTAEGTINILGKKRRLVRAQFKGVAGQWIEERVSFAAGGLFWHATVSYDVRYHKLLPVMLHVLTTFRLHPIRIRIGNRAAALMTT